MAAHKGRVVDNKRFNRAAGRGHVGTRVEVFRGKDRRFYFRLRARNGKIIAASEGYARKYGAQRGAQRVIDAW